MMEEKVIVSVIMPVYNAEKYLKESLESVINQTLKNIEIICVNDGATDSSEVILKEYAQKDSRIKIIQRTVKDNGAGGARNMGMDAAIGKYLMFLDADDLFEADMLEKLCDNAERTQAEVVVCDSYTYRSDKKIDVFNGVVNRDYVNDDCTFNPSDKPNSLFQIVSGAVWNKFFRHDFIDSNNIRFRENIIIDDLEFAYLSVSLSAKVSLILERFVHYRRDAQGSQTDRYDIHPEIIYTPWMHLKHSLIEKGLYDTYEQAFINKTLDQIRFLLLNLRTIEGFEKAYSALKDIGLSELGLSRDYQYSCPWQEKMIANIISCTSYEFLFKFTRGNALYSGFNLSLPFDRNAKTKVSVYGAGECGKKVVENMGREKNVELVSWHDRNYMAIGGNVENPARILDKDYDYVFVAVVDRAAFDTIENSLLDIGVEKKKIKWVGTPWNE